MIPILDAKRCRDLNSGYMLGRVVALIVGFKLKRVVRVDSSIDIKDRQT